MIGYNVGGKVINRREDARLFGNEYLISQPDYLAMNI
jgi:hypothetical protein